MSKTAAIGIDLGGTKTEIVLLAPDGAVLLRKRRPTPREAGYEAVLQQVANLTTMAVDELSPTTGYTIGIGIPGSLDKDTGLVRNANSICLNNRALQQDLEQLLRHPVRVRNDADCFTLAEARAGAARGFGLVFGVIMGTGCGGGICINGVVREGPHRIAGEWGHFSVNPDGRPCYCGNRGCIETLISGSGVEQAFFLATGQRLTMHEIVTRARTGDSVCLHQFEQFLDDFGRCLGGMISVLDPDVVVLGGGLSNIVELYHKGIERVRQYAFHERVTSPILKNSLGDSAGVFGAAWIGQGGEKLL